MAMDKKHVRVIGAGPAGLMAAEVLAAGGAKVTIIDHHANPGRKFLLAGRGGLNLTHSEELPKFLSRYGEAEAFLAPAIEAFPPAAVRAWCEGLGIETFVGSSGRVFPACMKASPVLRSWLRRLDDLGVTLQSKTEWMGFDDVPTILALGGASWPELGSNGSWVPVFEAAGIAVTPLRASNGRQRIAWSEHFASRFSGQPIKNVAVQVQGELVRGELMIAADGIEGGVIYALSRAFSADSVITIDLKPDQSAEHVSKRLSKPRGKESRSNYLRKAFNLGPVAIALMREAGTDNPKQVVFKTHGAADMRRAISTAGGVSRSEVGSSFRLHKRPNFWVVGEMLDWDAPTGGYLLQACFSTAQAAAWDCLQKL
jgi:uncharacterized flavoprotein (TIGR03862 family)